ncbi:MAG: hypothetical protein RBR74_11325 [Ignavibacteriaceae bacterium]|nr:hypothetical protein [Ignavibacteriaceae bacterium]
MIEEEAEDLIIAYCRSKGYQVSGFPDEKMKTIKEEEHEDYFCRERFDLYLDVLTTCKSDVAELMYYYNALFFIQLYDSLEDYVATVKKNLKSYGLNFD